MSIFKGMSVCDLRNITLEAAKEIEEIKGVGTLLLPKDASPELMVVLHQISQKGIGTQMYLDKEDVVNTVNGTAILTDAEFCGNKNTFHMVNGIVVVDTTGEAEQTATVNVIVNGVIVLKEKQKHKMVITLRSNGDKVYLDYDQTKVIPHELCVDPMFISYCQPRTLLIATSEISFDPGVTVAMLQEKQLVFAITNELECNPEIRSYLNATSIIMD